MEDFVPLEPVPGRKRPAQGVKISFDQPTIVFLTVCTKDRQPWLAQPAVQKSLEEIWRAADAWLLGDYLLMPIISISFACNAIFGSRLRTTKIEK